MVTEFRFPDVGEGITEGTVKKWLVKEGDLVDEDQVMAEVETDKAVVEMPSPVSGTVLKIHVQEDEVVNVGQVLVVIGGEGEEVPEPSAEPAPAVPAPAAAAPATSMAPTSPAVAPQATGVAGGKVRATPKVRRHAKRLGVDLATVTPTGSGGRVTEADVDTAHEAAKAAAAVAAPAKPATKVKLNYDFYGHIKHKPFKSLRKVIGDNMVESKYTAPHATAMEEVDTTALWDLRTEMKAEAEEQGVKLTFLPYIVMATCGLFGWEVFLGRYVFSEIRRLKAESPDGTLGIDSWKFMAPCIVDSGFWISTLGYMAIKKKYPPWMKIS